MGAESTYVGDAINIPKDLGMCRAGRSKAVTEADQPYAGAAVGDTYIDLQLNDRAILLTSIFPTKGLIDTEELEDICGLKR